MVDFRVADRDRFSWQAAVEDKDLTAPPGSPSEGDRYIVGTGATGAWSGHDDEIAEYDGASWDFYAPVDGWRVDVKDENAQYRHNGSAWVKVGEGGDVDEGLPIRLNFSNSNDWFLISSSSYKVACSFIFRGTTDDNPTLVKVVGSRTGTSGTVTFRVYDLTNAQEVALITWTAEEKAIYSDTSLQNLPSSEAIFEIQVKEDGSNGRLHSVMML